MRIPALPTTLIALLVLGCGTEHSSISGVPPLGAPARLGFVAYPSLAVEGTPFRSSIQVEIEDYYLQRLTTATDTVTLEITEGTGTAGAALRGGVSKAAVNGVATFDDVSVDKRGSGLTLTARSPGLQPAVSFAFDVTGPTVSVRITPPNPGLTTLGATLYLTTESRDSDGRLTNEWISAWTSSDSAKVRVSSEGLVTAVSYGTATITAGIHGITASTDVTVARLSGPFTVLSAGDEHTCGITTTGAAYCWGYDVFGQLGVGGLDQWPHTSPMASAAGLTLTSVSAGGTPTCGLTTSGGVYCWGSNENGELGDGSSTNSAAPVPVTGGLSFVNVSAAEIFACGVTTGGAAYCWGDNRDGELGNGSTAGPDQCGAPGNVQTTPCAHSPAAVAGGLTFTSVSAGGYLGSSHTCGVTASGAAYCWGANASGQLGNGARSGSAAPVAVAGGLTFSAVAAGWNHSCGLAVAGPVYCWGSTDTVPALVPGGLTFKSVSAGLDYSCGVTAGGSAFCWGANGSGQLGNGSTTNSATPVPVAGGLTFASISAGYTHACGLTASGDAYCWGEGFRGELGDGTNAQHPTPVRVLGQP